MRISDLNRAFTVQSPVHEDDPGGGPGKTTWEDKFSSWAKLSQLSTRKMFMQGIEINNSVYEITYRYQPDRIITVANRVLIEGMIAIPTGNCQVIRIDQKRYLRQLLVAQTG